jgi:hypothetical protein
MWTHSPEAALEIATGLHDERIARAEQLHLARRSRQNRAATAPQPQSQPFSRLISRIAGIGSAIRRGGAERDGSTSVPCPTGC